MTVMQWILGTAITRPFQQPPKNKLPKTIDVGEVLPVPNELRLLGRRRLRRFDPV
jgi:hypothetical protein